MTCFLEGAVARVAESAGRMGTKVEKLLRDFAYTERNWSGKSTNVPKKFSLREKKFHWGIVRSVLGVDSYFL
jgi:hypothetical protein